MNVPAKCPNLCCDGRRTGEHTLAVTNGRMTQVASAPQLRGCSDVLSLSPSSGARHSAPTVRWAPDPPRRGPALWGELARPEVGRRGLGEGESASVLLSAAPGRGRRAGRSGLRAVEEMPPRRPHRLSHRLAEGVETVAPSPQPQPDVVACIPAEPPLDHVMDGSLGRLLGEGGTEGPAPTPTPSQRQGQGLPAPTGSG